MSSCAPAASQVVERRVHDFGPMPSPRATVIANLGVRVHPLCRLSFSSNAKVRYLFQRFVAVFPTRSTDICATAKMARFNSQRSDTNWAKVSSPPTLPGNMIQPKRGNRFSQSNFHTRHVRRFVRAPRAPNIQSLSW